MLLLDLSQVLRVPKSIHLVNVISNSVLDVRLVVRCYLEERHLRHARGKTATMLDDARTSKIYLFAPDSETTDLGMKSVAAAPASATNAPG